MLPACFALDRDPIKLNWIGSRPRFVSGARSFPKTGFHFSGSCPRSRAGACRRRRSFIRMPSAALTRTFAQAAPQTKQDWPGQEWPGQDNLRPSKEVFPSSRRRHVPGTNSNRSSRHNPRSLSSRIGNRRSLGRSPGNRRSLARQLSRRLSVLQRFPCRTHRRSTG
jgi:hypothetical protein